MNYDEIERAIEEIHEHMIFIKGEIDEARRQKIERMRSYYNGGYENAGDNGNFELKAKLADDIQKWNDAIRRDP